MAFGGSATVVVVSDDMVRITGLTLAGGASGTIGLAQSTGSPGVLLPGEFMPGAGAYSGPAGAVALQDAVEVDVRVGATGVATPTPFAIVKTGTTLLDFLITITNVSGTLSAATEIYVKFHT